MRYKIQSFVLQGSGDSQHLLAEVHPTTTGRIIRPQWSSFPTLSLSYRTDPTATVTEVEGNSPVPAVLLAFDGQRRFLERHVLNPASGDDYRVFTRGRYLFLVAEQQLRPGLRRDILRFLHDPRGGTVEFVDEHLRATAATTGLSYLPFPYIVFRLMPALYLTIKVAADPHREVVVHHRGINLHLPDHRRQELLSQPAHPWWRETLTPMINDLRRRWLKPCRAALVLAPDQAYYYDQGDEGRFSASIPSGGSDAAAFFHLNNDSHEQG